VYEGSCARSAILLSGGEGGGFFLTSRAGILPYTKSKNAQFGLISVFGEKSQNWLDLHEGRLGWNLPSHGESYNHCGSFVKKGCLNPYEHPDIAYVKVIKHSCMRAECPICFEGWAGKEAEKIVHRLQQYYGRGQPIHVTASVPHGLYNEGMISLRKKSYKIMKKVGFIGGVCISHPFREACQICGFEKDWNTKTCVNCGASQFRWYFSPHFHFLGYGWLRGIKKNYEETGWVVKNLGVRKTLHGTAMYQLSHAGVHKKYHTVTWFGRLSYNNFKCKKLVRKEDVCPLCNNSLGYLIWIGEGLCPVPDEKGEYEVSSEGWTEVYRNLMEGGYYYDGLVETRNIYSE
jgi:hypothetical protein